ncbi:ATP-dependent helicase [Nocardioides marmoraquaticus]
MSAGELLQGPGGVRHRLVPGAGAPAVAPPLDDAQQAVVDHEGGPLLVLAGPGTGKTTTMVEAIVDRVERRGADPSSVLALTFSRKAAEQLRDRVTARLGRTTATTTCATFHSFAYGLIRRYAPPELYVGPLRLLSAPEQDVVLRELLDDTPESVRWPEALRRASQTRGFAHEVGAVLGRAREKGLDGDELTDLGLRHDAPELVAAGHFLEQYLTVLDDLGATDYADLIRRATLEAQRHAPELRAEISHVFVDEYQDTDPGQVAMLRALAGDGRDLVVVGDPHQSIYGFRGAEVRGILDFPREFPQRDGRPADVVALGTTRRFGPRLLTATQRVAGRLPLPGGLPEAAREAFTAPDARSELGAGRVDVVTFDTDRGEAEHVSDLLRRAHLEDGLAWHEMAVLVRSGRSSIPGLRRSLVAAGVPVEVAGDDVPLARDPSVAPLLDGLRAVLRLHDEDDPGEESPGEALVEGGHLDHAQVVSLLTGPLGGLDAGEVRALQRALRDRDKQRLDGEGPGGPEGADAPPRARHSRDLVRLALLRPGFLDGVPGEAASRARAAHRLLVSARAVLDDGGTAEEVLWSLWSGTSWPGRLRRAVALGGGAARRAHRDLDSVVALFAAAARSEDQRDHQGVVAFLETLSAQQLPSDTLAEQGVRGSAVRLLTAHRSKGLEWRLVVVCHVQAEGWPDLRRRATLLEPDRIGAGELVPPVSRRELLAEERRLFYVACTRARQRLVVTAVASSDDDGEQPSRFLGELGVDVRPVVGRPPRPLSVTGLVSELRRTLADPDAPAALRQAAATRLARLAGERAAGRQLVPQADPATWWGTRAETRSATPVREPDRPVPLSATVLDGLAACPLQWFLQREAGGTDRSHQAANVGQMVHALAERVGGDDLPDVDPADPAALDRLMTHVDAVWDRLEFRTPWSRQREHDRIRHALARFLRWHHDNPRELVGRESRFSTVVELDDGERVTIGGAADRVEVDASGAVVVVDLKTGRSAPSGPAVERHRQLALYQYAVDSGALAEVTPGRSGGAELVQLGLPGDDTAAKVQPQPVHTEVSPERRVLRDELARSATYLRTETFPATPGDACKDCAFVAVCPARSAGPVVRQ